MYAAITHVDKQSFPFSDVLRVYFSEIANHAKINGASAPTKIATKHVRRSPSTYAYIDITIFYYYVRSLFFFSFGFSSSLLLSYLLYLAIVINV